MLRFWGWNCKVGRYYPPDGGYGHAIALVWSARPIDGLGYFRIRQGTYAGGTEVRPGYWIPIDYQIVGGISSAMDADWRLWNLDKPEELYWLNM